MIMSLEQKKLKFKPRIKLSHNIYMDVVCAVIDLLVRLTANPSICFPQHFHSVFLTLVKMRVSVFHQAAPILAIADLGFIS